MKKIILLFVLAFSFSTIGQTKPAMAAKATTQTKQYKSAESGRYVTKSQATKSPSTTYSTKRKSN
jgi:hypothetical protein